jgi:hypothetical protein
VLPRKGNDKKYQAIGELSVIGKDTLRDHFFALQPFFRAVRGFKTLVMTPLLRYIWNRCCEDVTHLANSKKQGFASDMGRRLKEVTVSLCNMIFMCKLKGVMILN